MGNERKNKKFDAEVSKILNLVINSIYTNKEIFLRELISNSSDACDKLRYESINNKSLVDGHHKYAISINVDKNNNTITLTDSGIGMNKSDLINNIGTIAKSGTEKFLSYFSNNQKREELIGKFGVGFYSVFMVADEVTIISKKAGEKQGYLWHSNGKGEYIVGNSQYDVECGTKITLKVKSSEE